MHGKRRVVLVLGLLAILLQLLWPPQRVAGHFADNGEATVTRYVSLWSDLDDVVWLTGREAISAHETMLLTDSHQINVTRLAIALGITATVTGVLALLVSGERAKE